MAWRFHAIDATLSPWPRRLDGVEAHEGPRNFSDLTGRFPRRSAHNSEIYFPDAKADIGVSARPMGRTTKKSGTSVPHGYRGKLYTLVRRAGENEIG